ncbi:imidazoleglycerol-phosphate synthase, cyclase subunit [Cenarchaeum symbiosum A]|uniref:Imidazole glycerol phosphate synthase subunit HisF n=1 Tax=Cenarchaeum symbiosum (strain A) TaxID=414004 RepID=A0RZ78_CENSY|nr:imidazoleglycerol-phosphate synthase, cyclase subunit [Cenarchaeum symbiosum A]
MAGGRVVKGLHFESLRDAGDPVELAKKYSDEGADELVFLDITASDEGRGTLRELVRDVASVIDIPFTVGGGIGSISDAREILRNGADKVAINTAAVKDPSILTGLMEIFGKQCVVVAIDGKRVPGTDGRNIFGTDAKYWFEVFIYGGKKGTGTDAIWWAGEAARLGAGEVLLTSIDYDGTKNGYDIELTGAVAGSVPVPVVASGGCGGPEHMVDMFKNTDADAALAASIFHYDSHGIRWTKEHLRGTGIPVRL